MPLLERDIVLQGKDPNGNQTIDLPITRLGNIEDTADIKAEPTTQDYIPLIDSNDGGQMKKSTIASLSETVTANLNLSAEDIEDVATTTYVDDTVDKILPSGCIVLWSGSESGIPSGWALCNGQNGTPDLRDRFVVGAGKNYQVGNVGGSQSVTLTAEQMPSHTHGVSSLVIDSSGGHTHDLGFLGERSLLDSVAYGDEFIYRPPYGTGSIATEESGDHTHSISGSLQNTGGGKGHENRPPYYALCYIMKV